MPRVTRSEMVFSLKSFAAAMLAMYFASRAGLPRPFWALMTTYVVANSLAGAVRSKALYRFCGTLAGSAAAVLLVPALSNAPELLTLALALWVSLCLFFSLLDRTPRSYMFMLAGYTATLIGFPSVETPSLIFDTATARVEEIGLAILCATVVHSVVFPAGLAPSILGLIDHALLDAKRWWFDLMQPEAQKRNADPKKVAAERRQLAADITQLRLLSTHIPFDITHLRWTVGTVRAMQDSIAALLPTLSAVEDRLAAIERAQGKLPPDLVAVLDDIGQWLQRRETEDLSVGATTTSAAVIKEEMNVLHRAIRSLVAANEIESASEWEHALRIGLAEKLEELVDDWQACAELRQDIDVGLTGAAIPSRRASLSNQILHLDYGMALLSALAAALAISLCGAFWILTGWSMGSVATLMAAVLACLFATIDDPVPAIQSFLKFTLWSVPLSALYLLVLMPLVNDFGMLVAICAPLFLIMGCYMARPAIAGQMMPLFFGVASTLAMHDTANADIVSFLNLVVAQLFGGVVAIGVIRLMRSVGVEWGARRIQHATWRELGEMAGAGREPAPADAYAVRMLDRVGLLAPRLTQIDSARVGNFGDDALRALRVGTDILALQRVRSHLPAVAIADLLNDIALLFRNFDAGRMPEIPQSLSPHIDGALAGALRLKDDSAERHTAISALVGLRCNLFPDAPPMLITTEGGAA